MSRFRGSIAAIAIYTVLTACTPAVHAQTFVESFDTSNYLALATILPAGITSVSGNLENDIDTDIFGFDIDVPGVYTIISTDSPFDDNLLLFNALGQGIGASDDQGVGADLLDSRITIALTSGRYYIGVGPNTLEALDDNGNVVFNDDAGDDDGVIPGGPTAAAATHIAPEVISQIGAYTITFSSPTGSAAAPEPGAATLALPVLGILAAGIARRRQQK